MSLGKLHVGLLLAAGVVLGQAGFYQFQIDEDALGGPLDFSSLNRPIGPADFLTVRDGHFYRAKERVNLYGINLVFGASFPEVADAGRIAKRLRKLGINLVRLHHMDTSPDSDSLNARSLLTTGPYPSLNMVAVARLRGLLDEFKKEGIYIDLNLHVGYTFRPDVDNVPDPGEPFPAQSKPLHMMHPRLIALQQEYARKVIHALNLERDPILAVIETNNETSLVWAWQVNDLDKHLIGEYRTQWMKEWNAFLKAKYGSTDALRTVWGSLPQEQSLEAANVLPVGTKEETTPGRVSDYVAFLVDRDSAYQRAIAGVVLAAVPRKVPITGTQVGFGGLTILDSQAELAFQDNHFYVDHYSFPHEKWDGRDWTIRDQSTVGSGATPFAGMAIAREAAKPYTVSEFNQPWPNTYAAELDPLLAVFAAFQGWDSIMHFAYAHGRSWDAGVPNAFNLTGDWSKYAAFGQSAWLFRSGAIAEARQTVEVPVSNDLRTRGVREKRTGNIAGLLANAIGYDPDTAFVHRVQVRRTDDGVVPADATKSHGGVLRADTGEFTYDKAQRLFVIDGARAAGVFGFPGPVGSFRQIQVRPIGGRGFVSIMLTPLDDAPIATSGRLLLSNPGYTLRTLPGSNPPRPQKLIRYPGMDGRWTLEPEPGSGKPSGNMNTGTGPVWMERVECYVSFKTGGSAIAVYPLDGKGQRLPRIPDSDIQTAPRGFQIHIQADGQAFSPWYEIVVTQQPAS